MLKSLTKKSPLSAYKKNNQQVQKKIQALITTEYPESMDDDLEIPDVEIIANRKIRNARTYKNRLHGLRIHEDDDSVWWFLSD